MLSWIEHVQSFITSKQDLDAHQPRFIRVAFVKKPAICNHIHFATVIPISTSITGCKVFIHVLLFILIVYREEKHLFNKFMLV